MRCEKREKRNEEDEAGGKGTREAEGKGEWGKDVRIRSSADYWAVVKVFKCW